MFGSHQLSKILYCVCSLVLLTGSGAAVPSDVPTPNPTHSPTNQPTTKPSKRPTDQPTKKPTSMPSKKPTYSPTKRPTLEPTKLPTQVPSRPPTKRPTLDPTTRPSLRPTTPRPTPEPTTPQPTQEPTTSQPTTQDPTLSPVVPSNAPTIFPVAPVPDFDPNDREEIIIDDNDSETAKPVPVFSWNLILGPTPDVYRTEGTIQNAKLASIGATVIRSAPGQNTLPQTYEIQV